ncbi:MAG: hypothetical protein ACI4RK_02000 [Oscillospiraceae bacterium]
MYCENCGKKLIRGYQFCIECGTPVPPEQDEEETQAQGEQPAETPQNEEMPGIKPLGSEDGTLVFCPTCGMRMQKRTDVCEKCGMKLSGGDSNGNVPLVNTDPLGGDFGGMSDSDIAQIDQFVNNSGFDGSGVAYGGIDDGIGGLGGGNLNSEIEALNQQFANLNSTASEMPAISAPVREPEPPKPEPVPEQEDPSLGTFARRVDDFSMEAGMPETQFLSESGLPVINGGEMTEPDVPVQLEQNYDDINIEVKQPAAPVVEEPAYSEPVAEEPTYTEPVAEEPTYTEPVAEEPTYTEPVAEVPAYTEPEPIQLNRPAPPEKKEEEPTGPDLGKLVYCRNCGQDMYEKEEVCKNCGSPNKWNVKPLKHSVSGGKTQQAKEPFKLFGIFTVPTLIGAAVVVIGIIALVVFTNTANKSDDMIDPYTSVSKPSTTSAADSDASVPDDQPVNPIVTSEQSEPDATLTDTTEPVVSEQPGESAAPTAESQPDSSEPEVSEPDTSSSDTSKPADTSNSTPDTTTKVTPNTTTKATPKPTDTTKPTTTAAPVSTKPSATVSSEDTQRGKMIDAFEAISAEVGKLHVYAQATTYALDEGKTRTFYTSGMTKTLSSGKSTAASLFKKAAPSSSQLDSAYKGLEKLYNLYTDYYTYVTTSTDNSSKYSSNEATKWDSFNSTVKNSFNYKTLQTSNQTDADKSRTYGELMTAASSAASNSVSQFTTLQNAVTALKSSAYADKVMSTIYNDKTSNVLKAAGYYQTVLNYYGILSSGVPTEYSTAKSSLSSLSSDLDDLLGVFTMAGYNSLSGFKSECSSAIKAANNSISALNKAL